LTEFLIAPSDESAELSYLFPHGEEVILGASEAAGEEPEPVPAVADRILRDWRRSSHGCGARGAGHRMACAAPAYRAAGAELGATAVSR
jgi:hypothetical protein